ncbi:hypothetical protein GW17_00033117 [Ensete ventricosum]|nr:hypothetical protein GW17_00033117 [Ensete ventricosum]
MVGREGRCIYIHTQNTEIKWRIRDDDGNKEAGKDAEEAIILIFQGVSVKAEMTTGGDRGGEESLSKQRRHFGCFPLLSPLSPTGPVIGSSSGIEHGPQDTADRYTLLPGNQTHSIDPRVYRFSRTSRRTRPPAHEKAVGVGGRMNAVDGGVWVEERSGPPPPAGQLSACGAACEMPAES